MEQLVTGYTWVAEGCWQDFEDETQLEHHDQEDTKHSECKKRDCGIL